MSNEAVIGTVFGWSFAVLISCFIGGLIGSSVKRPGVGAVLGFLGPIGWIIVLLLPRDAIKELSTSNSNRQLTDEDRHRLEDVLVSVDEIGARIESLESILDSDHPNWRQKRDDGN